MKIPAGYPLEAAGPVLCAGITMFTPLLKFSADKGGLRVGVVGIGGLGQMGVRLAKAMGNTVTAISTSPSKEAAAREIRALPALQLRSSIPILTPTCLPFTVKLTRPVSRSRSMQR